MGEGRSDRSGKRQRFSRGVGKSSSDSEVAHAKGKSKGRKAKTKERWPFLEGLTVDELARYRRRRVQDRPKDNLQPTLEPTIQNSASEYRRAFGVNIEELSKENVRPTKDTKPEDYLDLGGIVEDDQASTHADFKQHKTAEVSSTDKEGVSSQLVNGHRTMETKLDTSQLVYETSIGRPSLIRRDTSLKCGGDFYTNTETYSAYVPYEGQHRAELARRPTSLKMEGDLDTVTEKCEKFVEWLNVSRPELMRIPTNLKMEGELETATENHDKYVPFVGARRPELLRQGTNLKLEGDTYFVPEYTDVFKDYNIKDRLQSKKHRTHLKTEGDFYESTENTESFTHPWIKQAQEEAELIKDEDNDEEDKRMKDQEENRKKDEEMKMLVSKLEDLNGRPLEIPEYRDSYKDFPRERPKIVRPDDEIGRADGSKVLSPSRSRYSMKIDQDLEYKSKYLDYPRDRPVYRKPPLMLRATAIGSGRSSACFGTPVYQERRTFEYEPTSEVRSQYVPYGHVPRVETLKMPANLRLEGNIDLQPEYRNAYCARYNEQAYGEPRMRSRDDRCLSASKRSENFWLHNNNSQYDREVQEQNAFRILNTRIHEENVTGKPPPASKKYVCHRGSKISQATVPRTAQLDCADRAIIRTRSPSPTYRLQVCDVDNQLRGFGRYEPFLGKRSPSGDRAIQSDVARPYSPSFGKETKQDRRIIEQPFVILDNAPTVSSSKTESRRKRTDRNYNVDITPVPISRGRPRTPTRWMPPWYDNTNTI